MNSNNSLCFEYEIKVKDKSEYKYAQEHIQKGDLDRQITYDSNTCIGKAEYHKSDLYLYIDNLQSIGRPFIKQSEMYFNCLLVIHGAKLMTSNDNSLVDITQEILEDVGIFFIDGYLRIQGDRDIIEVKNSNNSWVDFSFEFEDLSCYFDEIYDYFGGEMLVK